MQNPDREADDKNTLLAYIRELRQQGTEAIDILRALKIYDIPPWRMSTYIEEAFGIPYAGTMSIAYWGSSRSDESINCIIETLFAEKRIGGYLRPERVAAYLHISSEVLLNLLQEPQFSAQTQTFFWNNHGTLQKDIYILPELLRQLEAVFPDPHRPPWWYWSIEARNQDQSDRIRIY